MNKPIIVQIRIIADSQEDAQTAVTQLQQSGVAIQSARQGRKGQWLAYGTITFQPNHSAPLKLPIADQSQQ
ncbi:MAG: hypothetical protein LCH85_08505 [Chloroflexi bacterium]|nr:hypothetical protein [Chloroflexota bacterium]